MLNLIIFIVGVAFIIVGFKPFGLTIIAVISLFEAYALFHSELIIQNYKNHVIRVTLQRL